MRFAGRRAKDLESGATELSKSLQREERGRPGGLRGAVRLGSLLRCDDGWRDRELVLLLLLREYSEEISLLRFFHRVSKI